MAAATQEGSSQLAELQKKSEDIVSGCRLLQSEVKRLQEENTKLKEKLKSQ